MRNTDNPRIMLEYLFIKLSYFPRLVPIEEALARLGQSPSIPSAPSPRKVAPSTAPVDLGTALPAGFHGSKSRLEAALNAAHIQVEGSVVKILLQGQGLAGKRVIEESIPEIQAKAGELLGGTVRVQLEADLESAPPSEAEMVQQIKKDERISSLAEKIKGQIISIEQIKGE